MYFKDSQTCIVQRQHNALVAQFGWTPAGLTYEFAKECPTKFETRWLQEIPFSKELTDNYCALRQFSWECDNNNNAYL